MSRPKSNPEAKFYSKDYWDLVFEQLGKNFLFKVSMVNRQGLNVMPSGMFVKFQNAR